MLYLWRLNGNKLFEIERELEDVCNLYESGCCQSQKCHWRHLVGWQRCYFKVNANVKVGVSLDCYFFKKLLLCKCQLHNLLCREVLIIKIRCRKKGMILSYKKSYSSVLNVLHIMNEIITSRYGVLIQRGPIISGNQTLPNLNLILD